MSVRKPVKRVSRLTFQIVTTHVWDEESVDAAACRFQAFHASDMNVSSAGLVAAEEIDEPEDLRVDEHNLTEENP